MKILSKVAICFIIYCLVAACSNNKITNEEISKFIKDHNIDPVVIKKLDNKKYYLFSGSNIYVYMGSNHYRHSVRKQDRDGLTFGGLEKGSIGVSIKNSKVLKYGTKYSITIDNIEKTYVYAGDEFLVIIDERIWNPTPTFTVKFYDSNEKMIFSTTIQK